MSDKFYSYSDNEGDEINISKNEHGTVVTTDDAMTIPPEELPKLIAVLQSHLEDPTDDRPWYMIMTNSDLVGPFASEDEARDRCKNQGDMVRQVTPPELGIDHEDAKAWANRAIRDISQDPLYKRGANLARAYLELSAKQ